MTRRQQAVTILILGSLSTISPFAIDMYLPGFPEIAADLDTTIDKVQFSLTSYFIGIAVGQLIYGPLLDRFGRKPPLFIGLVIYILASIGCAYTFSVESLIAMRFLQALGGCVGMVAAQAFVRDLFPASKTAEAFSWMTLVVAVSPMIAPTVGGYVISVWNWHSVFIVLALVTAVILFFSYTILPDGKKSDESISLRPDSVLRNFWIVLKQPQFLIYCLGGGLAGAAAFAYIAGSPDVVMNLYGASEKTYGLIFGGVGAVLISGTQLNHVLLKKYSSEQIVKYSMIYQLAIGGVLITGTALALFNLVGLVIMMMLFLAAHGIASTNSSALALNPFKKHAGSAASLAGSFRMAMGGLSSGLVSFFYNRSEWPMITVMVMCILSGLIIIVAGNHTKKYRAVEHGISEKEVKEQVIL
jgi:MFS transporter, DHA1 family, multidrug resistance protein